MSEIVRQRLETLLAEVEPRHLPPSNHLRDDPVWPVPPAPPTQPIPEPSPPTHAPRRLAPDPAPLRELGGRVVEFGREHLAAVAMVLLVGCAWTAYSLLQAHSVPVAAAAVPTVVASPRPTPTPTPKLLVHVVGAVKDPGVVELVQGSRVRDAIEAAGGLTDKAEPGELNLAAMVADGDQVRIGTKAEPGGEVRGAGSGTATGGGSGGSTISLNAATLEQLDTLPGVGPVTAQKILDWRTAHGRFSTVEELQEVDGIGPKSYADIAPHVRV